MRHARVLGSILIGAYTSYPPYGCAIQGAMRPGSTLSLQRDLCPYQYFVVDDDEELAGCRSVSLASGPADRAGTHAVLVVVEKVK